ncbi:energy transducer TonB [Psychrobacter glaciei]|uniref:energy transducer TonB n=1 Tax=Psychrobacter glaciei TaxID=619771 RepID=UPI001F05C22D|nr:energy transducer TonB [Psychrobacter glaciei]MCH1782627.1 energy transducer TonB [Psychrobacter glaciei]
MSILIIMILPNPFTRPLNAWVTIFVVALHGATVWAMMSIDTPKPPEIKNKPETIQLELITLASPPTNRPSTEPQSKPVLEKKPVSETLPIKPLEKVVASDQTSSAATLKTETKEAPIPSTTNTDVVKKSPNLESNPENSLENPSSASPLTTVESRKISNASNVSDDTEQDLTEMMRARAVTAQFNRDQARQKRALGKQTNRKLAEQEQWRIQAANEAIANLLKLAAAQAEKQVTDQAAIDEKADKNDKVNKSDETAPFLADYGSWLDKHEPTTSLPLLIWRSVDTELGDVFIVMLELHVNKEGYITEVQLLEPSGSPIIDAMATTQVRTGQLNPLQKDGKTVDAIVPMSLVYERPTLNN